MQTMLCQQIQLVSTNPDVLERTRHSQLAYNGVENVAQVRRAGIDFVSFQNVTDDSVLREEVVDAGLAFNVGAFGGIELAHSRE